MAEQGLPHPPTIDPRAQAINSVHASTRSQRQYTNSTAVPPPDYARLRATCETYLVLIHLPASSQSSPPPSPVRLSPHCLKLGQPCRPVRFELGTPVDLRYFCASMVARSRDIARKIYSRRDRGAVCRVASGYTLYPAAPLLSWRVARFKRVTSARTGSVARQRRIAVCNPACMPRARARS